MELREWIDTQLGQDIWEGKYEYKKEGFNNWLDRISNKNEDLKQIILDKKFLFGGRILANRGLNKLNKKVTYSNCYVLPAPEDNIESIFDTAKYLARTFSYSGGVGIDISKLRPNGMKVHNAAETTTGSTSFMDLYSKVTEVIGARGRRGALMLSILCTHPDIMDFIDIKNDLDKVTKANISIRILDNFMVAVKEDKDWELYFDCKDTNERLTTTIKARDIYHKICENNWNMAEPGMLFWDTIEKYNLVSEDEEFEYAGTNPCAEEPLPAGGSCLLGSVNLSEFVKNPFTKDAYFDFDDFKKVVEISIKALNEVLDEGLPLHPLKVQQETVRDWRQIGIGIMGLADMFIKLGIRYGSKESLKVSDEIGFVMADTSLATSSLIAEKQGAYPKYKQELIFKSKYFLDNTTENTKDLVKKYGLANSQILTIAPTGSLSTMLGISGGIEPIFNVSYFRRTQSLHDEEVIYKVYTPIAEAYMKKNNVKNEEELPDIFITAMTLNYKERIDMQSVWQKHIDASISSTVNVPNEFTIEDVEGLYMYAWEKGLKGVTIYRDNCARSGILTNSSTDDTENEDEIFSNELKRGDWKSLAEDTIYLKKPLKIGCGNLKLFIGYSPSENSIQDLYIKKAGLGGCTHNIEAVAVGLSAIYRLGGSTKNIEKAFSGLGGCNSFLSSRMNGKDLSKGSSCATAILNLLKDVEEEFKLKPIANKIENSIITQQDSIFTKEELEYKEKHGDIDFVKKYNKCVLCGSKIQHSGGCIQCECGWSKCE